MGTLFVVATPIGNLGDVSERTIQTLRSVPLIAAEDTRHTRKLLNHFGIKTRMVSYHRHNEARRRDQVLAWLEAGNVALVSDAGTPGISDPGNQLVDAALRHGHAVSPIPGPSALSAGVGAAGLVSGPFVFVGFPPRGAGDRRELFAAASAAGFPLVLFEAANRVVATLDELAALLGDRPVTFLRELTKLHEEVRRATLASLADAWRESPPRGEIVLVIGAADRPNAEDGACSDDDVRRLLATFRSEGMTRSQAARRAAVVTGRPRSEIYDLGRLHEAGVTNGKETAADGGG